MQWTIRRLLVLLTLGASVCAGGCSPPQEHSATATGGASASLVPSGASGTSDAGGQISQGGATAGGATAGGTTTSGATAGDATAGGATAGGATAGGAGAPSGGSASHQPNFVKTRLNAEFYSE